MNPPMHAPEESPEDAADVLRDARPGPRSRIPRRRSEPLFGRSLLTSVMIHGTIFCGAVLLTPGLRHAAGRALQASSLVFSDPLGAPEPMVAQSEVWRDLSAEEPPEPELVEVPMEPAPADELEDEPDLTPVDDTARMWAKVELGPLARHTAPTAETAPSIPPAKDPQDDADALQPAAPLATGPVLVKAPPPIYPAAARRLGLEGTVLLRIEVSATGKFVRCEVVEGSGFERLDRAALEAVRHWTFLPATSGGLGIRGQLLHRVTFGLEA